ncbi:hypothetical protein DPMN_123454 [Dreissena polymorpha]|uniref:Uncharacterized protein n=1 Tax=Dreissena polymorpha TaxID=45954 RepID=A0A9D4GXH8_DREPO|nr:hypothetical protein DPMN_123454 [Dreissena polymorpha]
MAQPDIPTDLRWQDTTEEEMRAFLAINILMGINHPPMPRCSGRLIPSSTML